MLKIDHEFRDPIHGFVHLSRTERKVVDSWPFQRLRHIHQLAMTYLVYPGATHKRFEHSLGVMELASRVYRVITDQDNLPDNHSGILDSIPEVKEAKEHWHKTLRMAALCHDMGHLPFSHANEDLLPKGYTHERITWDIIHGDDLAPFWREMHLDPDEIGKLALGPKEMNKLGLDIDYPMSTWEALLSEIIVGDAFGVDRMDYLLRDSHHLGVKYGKFDLERIVQGLRITAPAPESSNQEDQSLEPAIGVEIGSLHAAASLLWARYSIFSQVYFHHVRRIYDIHLKDFMRTSFPDGFPIDCESFLKITDNEVLAMLHTSMRDSSGNGHEDACRISGRGHFRCVYRQTNVDLNLIANRGIVSRPVEILANVLKNEFGDTQIRFDIGNKKHRRVDFPVLLEGTSQDVLMASQEMPTINMVPNVEAGYIFAAPDIRNRVHDFLASRRTDILNSYED